MKLFVIIHRLNQDVAAIYEGMDQQSVGNMLSGQGLTFEFVDEASYNTFVAANQRPSPLLLDITLILRSMAIDELNLGTQPLIKVARSVISLLVDELNLLRQRDNDRATDVAAALSLADLKVRWAARATLPDRTMAQAKNALQNKINAGTAD